MARFARQGIVFAQKLEPGIAVAKFQGVEPDDLEISSMMFVMAGETFPAFNIRRCVITLTCRGEFPDLLMAIEALGRGNLFPDLMAFRAVRQPFEVGMCGGQVARRYLCQAIAGQDQE